ncbi:T9SS type A sorting domain-containing protein [Flavobacterium psychrophilum]|uniref:T9SS type A sorting domain-containing protein n=1 Tax=Flavobacterium psychrophilum TaxID=96345 RepID=UPI00061879FA|nr:T9SS type A sorting domain-containing protein [Flavobacterium psychrophilum]AKC20652.1 hypothetical protein IY37_00030 [Flavobacterium psychrophilum]
MKKKLLPYLLLCCAFFSVEHAKAQTLQAGDIAFVGINAIAPDGFSFIALKPLPAGETLFFTDQGWHTGNVWTDNQENHLKWIIPAGGIACGTVISVLESSSFPDTFIVTSSSTGVLSTMTLPTIPSYPNGGLNSGFNIPTGGDQILAYQSSGNTIRSANPTIIAGVHAYYEGNNYNTSTTWNISALNGGQESIVPLGLTNTVNCVSISLTPGIQMMGYNRYSGTLTGTAAAIRASINNPVNWAHTVPSDLTANSTNYPNININCAVATTPTVTTATATGVGATKATMGGNVTADAGAAVTERGIVWATTTNPTTANNKATNGTGTGVFSGSVSSLPATTTVYYRAFATNSGGTSYGANLSFTTGAALAITSTNKTNVTCNAAVDGTATVTVSGGVLPYSYLWSPSGGTGASASGLNSGNYSCTIIDSESTQITSLNVNIQQPAPLNASISNITNATCNGGSNGTATVVAPTNGTAPYTYLWSTGATGTTATGLAAGGPYSCKVTAGNGCYIVKNFSITQPSAISTSTGSQTNLSCNGGTNGSASVTPSGGTPGYTYSWSPSGGTAATATGLAAGSYTVTVTDANGCTATRNYIVTQPSAISTSTGSQTNVSCNGGTNGSASVTPSGGTPGYTYSWAPSGGTAATATGLAAGSYTVTVTDANGCAMTKNFTITEPTAIDSNVTLASGVLEATQTGATYQWYQCPNTILMGNTNRTYTPIIVGTYKVEITLGGCTSTSTCVTVPTLNSLIFDSTTFKCYPIPTSSDLNISYDKIIEEVQVINLLGQPLLTNRTKGKEIVLDLSELPDATYFVKIISEGKSKIIRILKK